MGSITISRTNERLSSFATGGSPFQDIDDNMEGRHCELSKWKNYELILENHHIYVYPRVSDQKVETRFDGHKKIHVINAPLMELSSTFIRNAIKEGKNVQPMLPQHVWEYLDEMNFYK